MPLVGAAGSDDSGNGGDGDQAGSTLRPSELGWRAPEFPPPPPHELRDVQPRRARSPSAPPSPRPPAKRQRTASSPFGPVPGCVAGGLLLPLESYTQLLARDSSIARAVAPFPGLPVAPCSCGSAGRHHSGNNGSSVDNSGRGTASSSTSGGSGNHKGAGNTPAMESGSRDRSTPAGMSPLALPLGVLPSEGIPAVRECDLLGGWLQEDDHSHGPGCGHAALVHNGHIDFVGADGLLSVRPRCPLQVGRTC